MPIEKWSDQISIARLASDTHFTDEIDALGEHASTAASDIVLDLTTVRYINSSQIARLLKLRRAMVNAGRRLVVCGVDPQVWGTFIVTGLDKIFEVADTVP